MKIAVLGVWHVHAEGYTKEAQNFGAEIVGFFEREDALAQKYAEKFDVPRFATVEELLASDAEGVIVCSATCDHTEDIVRAAKAGKHIFTEKVLALTDKECDEIEAAIGESGVSFTISLFQKYLGSRITVKQIAESGELGKINYMRFRNCHGGSVADWLPAHFYNEKQCGGGAMIDLGAHGMYLTEWILGMPDFASSAFTVSCESDAVKAKNPDGVEDNAVTVMRFPNGAIAVNETGFVSGCTSVILEVHGERGYVCMENNTVIKCTIDTNKVVTEVEVAPSESSPLEQFVTQKPLPGCSLAEAKALTHMMTMAYNA